MRQFSSIEKLDTGILYILELAQAYQYCYWHLALLPVWQMSLPKAQ